MLSESSKEEARIWLQTCLEEIAKRLGLSWRDGGDATAGKSFRDTLEFVGFTEQVVYRGMEKELAAVEKERQENARFGDHREVHVLNFLKFLKVHMTRNFTTSFYFISLKFRLCLIGFRY